MNKPLKLSYSIVSRVPIGKQSHTLQNLHWIGRNMRLSNAERAELLQAIQELRKQKGI